MAGRQNPKRDKQIEKAGKIAAASGMEDNLDPFLIFSRASSDDLENYTPEMLALCAGHAARRLKAWTRIKADITIETLDGVEPDGMPVSIITVIDRNMPFLFDSVMGEVTTAYRDLTMAVHPILVIEPGKQPTLHSSERPGDPAHHVSLIQIHVPQLNDEQADGLVERIRYVLNQVHQAITGWSAMLGVLKDAQAQLVNAKKGKKADADEAYAFLDWLRNDNFTFLGMREYTYSGKGADAKV
ncbi:MAG: NAD-glutamate dehydrogenase, partial [Rhizobiaceae bacterium]